MISLYPMLPDISIIVTCYNYGHYLERCLRSLYNQKHNEDFTHEIIVIDDCSNDMTASVVAKFGEKVNNLIYHRHFVNKGLAASSNTGISMSSGRYIVRVDADDYVSRHFCFMFKFVLDKNRSIQAVKCDYTEINDNEEYIRTVNSQKEMIACATMYRRECLIDIGGYDESFEYREGHELNNRFSKKYTIGHIPVSMYFVRKHKSNRSLDEEKIKEFESKIQK